MLTLSGKEPELVEEASKRRLDIVGLESTKRKGTGSITLDHGWTLYWSGVDPTAFAQAGVGILTSLRLADSVIEWKPISDRVALIRLRMECVGVLTVVQVYGPNDKSDYDAFLEKVDGTLWTLKDAQFSGVRKN